MQRGIIHTDPASPKIAAIDLKSIPKPVDSKSLRLLFLSIASLNSIIVVLLMSCRLLQSPLSQSDIFSLEKRASGLTHRHYEPIPLIPKRDSLFLDWEGHITLWLGVLKDWATGNGSYLRTYFPAQRRKRGRGMPHAPCRHVLNSLLYMLITGGRWCDLPRGNIWASKSASHRWLKRWRQDGTKEHLQGRILALANERGLINWDFGAVDGSFSPGIGGGEEVAYGGKGKGVLIHTLTEGNGMP